MSAAPAPADDREARRPARNAVEPAPTHGPARRQCRRCGGTLMELVIGERGVQLIKCVGCGAWVPNRAA